MENKSYQLKIVNQLVADHELYDDLERTDAVEKCEEEVFRKMTLDQRISLYTTMVLKGESMPYYMLLKSALTSIRPFFRDAYLCPLNVTVRSENINKTVALSFAQFKTLSQIFRGVTPDLSTPLICSKEEYWYLLCLANITIYGDLFRLPSDTACYVKLRDILIFQEPKWTRIEVATNLITRLSAFETLYGVGVAPFTTRTHMGHSRYPSLTLNMDNFSLTAEQVQGNLNYWGLFCESRRASTEVNELVGFEVIQACDPRPDEELPSVVPIQFEGAGLPITSSNYTDEVVLCGPTDADYFQKVIDRDVAKVLEDGACPAKLCEHEGVCPQAEQLEREGEKNNGVREPPDLEEIINTVRPRSSNGVVADYGRERAECARLKYELQSGFVVLIEETHWRTYIQMQQKLSARDNGNQMHYRSKVGCERRLAKDLIRWREKNKHDPYGDLEKPPEAASKWADLFVKSGLAIEANGECVPNQDPRPGNVEVLEVTPFTFGAALAAIEMGVCTRYKFVPSFDKYKDAPDYGELCKNLLDGCNRKGVSLTSLADSVACSTVPIQQYSLLIVDLPILRFDDRELTVKQIISRNFSQMNIEDVTDVPLGDQEAITLRMGKIKSLMRSVVALGGALIFSLNFVLTDKAVLELFSIVRRFERIKLVRTSYSKPLQREIYVCCFGYLNEDNDYVDYSTFLNFVVRFNTNSFKQMNDLMHEVLERRVCPYSEFRTLGCRKHLSSYKGLIPPQTYRVIFVGDRSGAQHTLEGTRSQRSAALTSLLFSDIMKNSPEDPNKVADDQDYWDMMESLMNENSSN